MSNKEIDRDVPAKSELAQAEEPIESRLLRAYINGFRDGAQRASWGRGDYS